MAIGYSRVCLMRLCGCSDERATEVSLDTVCQASWVRIQALLAISLEKVTEFITDNQFINDQVLPAYKVFSALLKSGH